MGTYVCSDRVLSSYAHVNPLELAWISQKKLLASRHPPRSSLFDSSLLNSVWTGRHLTYRKVREEKPDYPRGSSTWCVQSDGD